MVEFIKNIQKEKCYCDFTNQCLTFLIKMSSKTDVRACFKRRATGSDGPAAKKKNPNPEIIASTTEHVNRAETEMVIDGEEKSTARQSYNNIPKHICMEVGKYALAHNTKDALAKFSKQHPKYTFKRTSINSIIQKQ